MITWMVKLGALFIKSIYIGNWDYWPCLFLRTFIACVADEQKEGKGEVKFERKVRGAREERAKRDR